MLTSILSFRLDEFLFYVFWQFLFKRKKEGTYTEVLALPVHLILNGNLEQVVMRKGIIPCNIYVMLLEYIVTKKHQESTLNRHISI